MKRTHGPDRCIPGGRQDIGESAHECCVRETEEETGLKTEVKRLIGLYTNPSSICAYPDNNVHQSYIALFECTVLSGVLTESDEGSRFHWMAENEIDKFLLLPDNILCVKDAWAGAIEAVIR